MYDLLYYQKKSEITSKNVLEYIDFFKYDIYLSYFNEEKNYERKLFEKLIYCSLNFNINKNNASKETIEFNYLNNFFERSEDFQKFIYINFYILVWFCIDVNKFIFKFDSEKLTNYQNFNDNIKIYFEDEYNEKVYKIILKYYSTSDCKGILLKNENYNKSFSKSISDLMIENINCLKNFCPNFYNLIENYSYKFKSLVKIMLVLVLEYDHVIIIFKIIKVYIIL